MKKLHKLPTNIKNVLKVNLKAIIYGPWKVPNWIDFLAAYVCFSLNLMLSSISSLPMPWVLGNL
jgi:hypothetical protein